MILSDIYKIGVGLQQRSESKRLGRTSRPKYLIPDSLKKLVAMTQYEAGVSGLPGQGQIENKMARQGAGTTNAILHSQQSPAAMLAGLTAVDQNQKEGIENLGIAGANYRDQKQGAYYNALGQMGQQETAQWEWDQKNPYLNAMAASSALKNASLSNIGTGIEGLEGAGMSILGGVLANRAGQTMGERHHDLGATPAPRGNMSGGMIPNTPSWAGADIASGGQDFLSGNRPSFGQTQGGWGGGQQNLGGFMGGSPNDDWLMYGDRMKQLLPGIDEDLLKEQMPLFKAHYLTAMGYGG